MRDIFISYARQDRTRAEAIARALEDQGWSVWWDWNIPAGKTFRQVIQEQLDKARCVIVLWSATSVTSKWVIEEASEGEERGILVPVFIEKVRPPLGFRSIHAADLVGWEGEPDAPAFRRLCSDVDRLIQRPKVASPDAIVGQDIWLARRFLEQAGCETELRGDFLLVPHIKGRLQEFAPLYVMTVRDAPTEDTVAALAREGGSAGILIYGEPPDELARLGIARARMRENVSIIPIPLAEVERALVESSAAGVLASYADRYLPGANLYDDRNAISDALTFFGRTAVLNRLQGDLTNLQGVGVFGLRKSGKTSTILQLDLTLRGYPVVRVDLQGHGEKTRFGRELLQEILDKLIARAKSRVEVPEELASPLREAAAASEIALDFQHKVAGLAPLLKSAGFELPIVCCLDEMERILPVPSDPRERVQEFNAVFGSLRALSQESRILALLVTDVHPDCNRINHWAQPDTATNPLYNFFKELYLGPFDKEETDRMLTDIGRLMGIGIDKQAVAAICRQSGGHPYLARQLASRAWEKSCGAGASEIQYAQAKQYIEKPFSYSGLLESYLSRGIWEDLDKRHSRMEMSILRSLALSADTWVRESSLVTSSAADAREILNALIWLLDVGLVARRDQPIGSEYRIAVPLLAQWIEMGVVPSEVHS
jgi:hypothetical protein